MIEVWINEIHEDGTMSYELAFGKVQDISDVSCFIEDFLVREGKTGRAFDLTINFVKPVTQA